MTDQTITRDDQIVTAYQQGQSLRAIGATHDISGERVRQVLAARGVTRRNVGGVTKRAYETWAIEHGDTVEARLRTFPSVHTAIDTLADEYPKTWVRRLIRERIPRNEWSTYSRRINHYTDTELLDTLRSHATNNTLSAKRYNDARRPGDPSFTTFVLRFGSWAEACRRADLTVSVRPSPAVSNWTLDELHRAVRTYVIEARASGHEPTRCGYDAWRNQHRLRDGIPSPSTLRVRTGKSWLDLVAEVSE